MHAGMLQSTVWGEGGNQEGATPTFPGSGTHLRATNLIPYPHHKERQRIREFYSWFAHSEEGGALGEGSVSASQCPFNIALLIVLASSTTEKGLQPTVDHRETVSKAQVTPRRAGVCWMGFTFSTDPDNNIVKEIPATST